MMPWEVILKYQQKLTDINYSTENKRLTCTQYRKNSDKINQSWMKEMGYQCGAGYKAENSKWLKSAF